MGGGEGVGGVQSTLLCELKFSSQMRDDVELKSMTSVIYTFHIFNDSCKVICLNKKQKIVISDYMISNGYCGVR